MNQCFDKYRNQKIQLLDLSREYDLLKNEIHTAIENVLSKGWFILGDYVTEFENDFAKYNNYQYGIGVASGLDALTLALVALDIKAGDEVLLPANSFIATALAVSKTGASPVFVDIDEKTFNICPIDTNKKISKKTKAIIPVHLYGKLAPMKELKMICQKNNLKLVSDASQAHGLIDIEADIACYSLHPIKNIGAYGDAGIILSNDISTKENLLKLRNYGFSQKYHCEILGCNSRLDELQAAILSVKLKYLSNWVSRRQEIAKLYDQKLSSIKSIILPQQENNVFYAYTIRVLHHKRDLLKAKLEESGIGTTILYPIPLHLQKCYSELSYKPGDMPVTEQITLEILSIPISPFHLDQEIELVAQKINEILD